TTTGMSQPHGTITPARLDNPANPETSRQEGQYEIPVPVIADRALQALAASALEPEWEARFESRSYGFRPGRSCQDAMQAIFVTARGKTCKRLWALDADLAAAFDRIDHDHLLSQLGLFPARGLVAAWLKAGVIDRGHLAPTERGSPQGGLCAAAHNDPYEQCRVMRSAGPLALVTATLGIEHCA
ncbi:MAG TPA: reverse transcriptase domain-containing protein, partial [Streptosporangiaceae bacterium]|nr:reverse transcriptase domain-containing protein [Streptosporangiaceae bacterium]